MILLMQYISYITSGNPLNSSDVRWLHFEVFNAIQV